MKHCPTCLATYSDYSLNFCLSDGHALIGSDDFETEVLEVSVKEEEIISKVIKKYSTHHTIYFHPNIDQFKLTNFELKTRKYRGEVLIFLDDSFFGNGKSGLIITHKEIVISHSLSRTYISQKLNNIRDIRLEGLFNVIHIVFKDLRSVKLSVWNRKEAQEIVSILKEYLSLRESSTKSNRFFH